jgi:hypothetical protein
MITQPASVQTAVQAPRRQRRHQARQWLKLGRAEGEKAEPLSRADLAIRARPCERELANRYVAGRHRHHLVPDDLRKPAPAKTVNPPAHDGCAA